MTYEEIVEELQHVIEREQDKEYDADTFNLGTMAQDCLRFIQEQHNPSLDENGLAWCGCGQPLALKHNPGRCEVPYDDPSDPDNWTKRPTWWVECKKCGLAIGKWHDEDFSEERGWYDSAEEAVHAANRAMGVKGADE